MVKVHQNQRLLQLNIPFYVSKMTKSQELWDINNGVTLCVDCHKLIRQGRPKIHSSQNELERR